MGQSIDRQDTAPEVKISEPIAILSNTISWEYNVYSKKWQSFNMKE